MEYPIQVFIRVFPEKSRDSGEQDAAISSLPHLNYLPKGCSQNQTYQHTVLPVLMRFLEGFDVSVLTYGHSLTGKSYTLFGKGFEPSSKQQQQPEDDGDDEGLILRSIQDIFANLGDRNFIIHAGWIEIGPSEEVVDLLQKGIVQCQSYNELLQLLRHGWDNLSQAKEMHNMFTLTLEQQWVAEDGRLQHRLSTISFCDLATSERVVVMNNLINREMLIHKNGGLQALENVISCLSMAQQSPMWPCSDLSAIPYNGTVLSTLLKDSFGGRAQTTLIVCVSPQEARLEEAMMDLQFALKAQCVRNYVTMNAFVDNNTISANPEDVVPDIIPIDSGPVTDLIAGASSYLQKLVANAEQVFVKLIGSQHLSAEVRSEVDEWLYKKAAYINSVDLNSVNASRSQQLIPIREEESEELSFNGVEMRGGGGARRMKQQQHHHQTTTTATTTDSESEYQRADLDDKIDHLMAELQTKTDTLVEQRYNEYLRTHPRPIFESVENLKCATGQETQNKVPPAEQPLPERQVRSGRRKSIQPGQTLSSLELEMLNRLSGAVKNKPGDEVAHEFSNDSVALCLRSQKGGGGGSGGIATDSTPTLKRWKKVVTDIEATTRQLRELEHTIGLKQKLIAELVKSNDTRATARARFQKKRAKLDAEYEKIKRQLTKAVAQGKSRAEVDRLKGATGELERRLRDLASIRHIATDSGQNLKKLEQSLVESRRECDILNKTLAKERRLKEALEHELDRMDKAETGDADAAAAVAGSQQKTSNKNLNVVNDRLSHLDHVLRQKSEHMERYHEGGEKRESLRHEIRNLRRTRDHLLDQRCELARKLKREKVLTNTEERKLLECDEAIEAIDAAIELKNELICGRLSVDTSTDGTGGLRQQREKGEQMLMARLNKLSEEEMRTLLYKYFLKVIDLRESGRKLEVQLMSIERERDTWEWRERMLSHALRQARLEGERNVVLMQREHETKLTLMLQHLANETGSSMGASQELGGQELEMYGKEESRAERNFGGKFDVVSCDRFKKQQHPQPREKGHQVNNKLFAKFQVLTQYSNEKRVSGALIPTHNLRQLQLAAPPFQVTREKNKLIIQQCQERNRHEQHREDASNGNALQYPPALHYRK